jgi:hypothetical protein
MDESQEIPFAFLLFFSDFQFSEACSFCMDFDIDVLELFINGFNCLAFFTPHEYSACEYYCILSGFEVKKYV